MTVPKPSGPAPPPPSEGIGCTALAIVSLIGVLIMVLVCGSVGVALYVVVPKTMATIDKRMAIPGVPAPPVFNEWTTTLLLTQIYKTALEKVAADKQVIEHLGGPIEIGGEEESLYERQRSGPLNAKSEKITFEIKGSKETGSVSVIARGAKYPNFESIKITVKCSDGAVIQVPVPQPQLPPQ